MLSRVRDTIKNFSMLFAGQRVLTAVSGGPDSMAMLQALYLLRHEFEIELAVAHLNHNLRAGESKRDFEFVEARARDLGLEFFGRTLRAGSIKKSSTEGLQATARDKRLAFLFDTAKKFNAGRIAMGHTMDDQAETMLMRFMKGSALPGLSGMWPVRGLLIKPLLELSRAEVMAFISEQGIEYIVDSSNLKDSYLRNNIRHHLLPFIKDNYNPSIIESLARTASVLRHDNDYIEAIAGHLGVVIKKTKREIVLDGARLRELHHALLTRVFLGSAAALLKRSRINSAHIAAFVSLVRGRRPNAAITLAGGLYARREYERIIISCVRPHEAAPFDVTLEVPGKTKIKGVGTLEVTLLDNPPASFKKGTAYFDYKALSGLLKVRSFKHGDRLRPLGMKGHRKVKEIFIDEKIPIDRRGRTPIVCLGDEVIWVAGLRQSEACKVKAETVKTLVIKFRPAYSIS